MKYNKILTAVAAVAVAVLLSACGSHKNAVTAQQQATSWQSVQMPVRVSLEKPRSFNLSGRVTMLRDSVINISLRVLGMEVAAINLNADSLWVVDRFHKVAFAEGTQRVLGQHTLTVGQIQDILLGLDTEGNGTMTFGNADAGRSVSVTFSDYADTPAGRAASSVSISSRLKNTPVQASLRWGLDQAAWDTPGRTVNFKLPKGDYRMLNLDNVLELLSSAGFGTR